MNALRMLALRPVRDPLDSGATSPARRSLHDLPPDVVQDTGRFPFRVNAEGVQVEGPGVDRAFFSWVIEFILSEELDLFPKVPDRACVCSRSPPN